MRKIIQRAVIYPNFKYQSIEKINGYNIIYLGSEFCANMMPSLSDIQTAIDKGYEKVVLFVPFLTQRRFKDYSRLIDFSVKKFKKFIEISTSDLGIINLLSLKYPDLPKNISRPLSIEFVRMKEELLKKALLELKIDAIETDEPLFAEKIKKMNVKVYFHSDFAFVAVQRHCPFVGKITYKCNRLCKGREITLNVPESNYKIYVRNNVYLKKEKKIVKGVYRIIHWP